MTKKDFSPPLPRPMPLNILKGKAWDHLKDFDHEEGLLSRELVMDPKFMVSEGSQMLMLMFCKDDCCPCCIQKALACLVAAIRHQPSIPMFIVCAHLDTMIRVWKKPHMRHIITYGKNMDCMNQEIVSALEMVASLCHRSLDVRVKTACMVDYLEALASMKGPNSVDNDNNTPN